MRVFFCRRRTIEGLFFALNHDPNCPSLSLSLSHSQNRKVFAEAEEEFKEKGSQARLHVIIFDEVDALMRKRGSRHDSSGVLDSCVNQLLAKIDGLAANDNILVMFVSRCVCVCVI